jgi:hypothetical protein
MPAMITLLALALAFVVGSIPTGVIVARAKGVDLRKVGSGNIGATNVSRALGGKKWAAVVLVADAAKGALPVLLLGRLFPGSMAAGLGRTLRRARTDLFDLLARSRRQGRRHLARRGHRLGAPARPGVRSGVRALFSLCFASPRSARSWAWPASRFSCGCFTSGTWPRLTFAVAWPCWSSLATRTT